MTEERKRARATGRRVTGLVAFAALSLGLTIGVTSAAWVDPVSFGSSANVSSFDIQARFASDEEWQDVGLPGSPHDSFDDGYEIAIPPIKDVLPGHSYLGDVFLCNSGQVNGRITDALLTEETTSRTGGVLSPVLRLVQPGSIVVDNIDVGTVIRANSCEPFTVEDPAFDAEGVIRFTTTEDFTGQYGSTSRIVIKIWVTSDQ